MPSSGAVPTTADRFTSPIVRQSSLKYETGQFMQGSKQKANKKPPLSAQSYLYIICSVTSICQTGFIKEETNEGKTESKSKG